MYNFSLELDYISTHTIKYTVHTTKYTLHTIKYTIDTFSTLQIPFF